MPSPSENRKRAALLELAKRRQADRLPPHSNLSDFHNGYYECDFVSPWTISAQNVDSPLMLIGQDWLSSSRLNLPKDEEQKRRGQTWNLPTNETLRCLLQRHMALSFGDTYATNLFPFIKPGRMTVPIPTADLDYCASRYAIPQIKIVAPKMVVCLGRATFDALRRALPQPPIAWAEACWPNCHTLLNDIEIYGAPHPGRLGVLNAGGMTRVHEIWSRLSARLRELSR